jgi:hypothetical protein
MVSRRGSGGTRWNIWDPVKQKLLELDEKETAQDLEEVTVDFFLTPAISSIVLPVDPSLTAEPCFWNSEGPEKHGLRWGW